MLLIILCIDNTKIKTKVRTLSQKILVNKIIKTVIKYLKKM